MTQEELDNFNKSKTSEENKLLTKNTQKENQVPDGFSKELYHT